jgi:hypothetical protein
MGELTDWRITDLDIPIGRPGPAVYIKCEPCASQLRSTNHAPLLYLGVLEFVLLLIRSQETLYSISYL